MGARAGIEPGGFSRAAEAESCRLRASKAPWRAVRFQPAGMPVLHCKTVEACLSPVARAAPPAGRFVRATERSDLAAGGSTGLGLAPVSDNPVASSSQRAARSFAAPSVSPLLSSSAPWESCWKPTLTSPSRDASRACASGCGLPSGWVAERTSVIRRWWASSRLTSSIRASPSDLRKSASDSSTTVSGASIPGSNFEARNRKSSTDRVFSGSSVSKSWMNSVRSPSVASGIITSRVKAQLRSGRAMARPPRRSQYAVERLASPSNARGWIRASRMSRAGVRLSVAKRASASPIATLGPVLENSLNRVVPISSRPTMIVPALVARAENDRASVTRIAAAGLLRLRCSANRQDRNRQKSVPVPNRIAIRNSSTSDETSQPATIIQAKIPRDHDGEPDRHQRDQ